MARIDEALAGEATWSAWWLDQLGHVGLGTAYALVAIVPTLLLGGGIASAIGGGFLFALAGGVGREIYQWEKSGKPHLKDRTLDALFHLPGAPIAFGIVLGVRALL